MFTILDRPRKDKRDTEFLDECLICHRKYKDLQHHINAVHLMKKLEYQEYLKNLDK